MSLGNRVLCDGSRWAELMNFTMFVVRDYLSRYLLNRLKSSPDTRRGIH